MDKRIHLNDPVKLNTTTLISNLSWFVPHVRVTYRGFTVPSNYYNNEEIVWRTRFDLYFIDQVRKRTE